jgi:hypothetical protein
LGDPLKGNLLLLYKPLHLEAQQVSTRIEVRGHQDAAKKLRAKVKQWTLKKMAELFRSWKNKLWKNYLKTKKVPIFEGYLAKQANHWKAF